MHLWEHRHGPDSPEAGIVRQLRAERDEAWEALAGILPHVEDLDDAGPYDEAYQSDDLKGAIAVARAALPNTQETGQ